MGIREYHKQRRELAAKQGRCVSHPSRKAHLGIRCRECIKNERKRKEHAKKLGFCCNHKEKKAEPNRTMCAECMLSKRLRGLRVNGLPEQEIKKAETAWAEFDGKCQSCGTKNPGGKGSWCFDHDYENLTFRGIVCAGCNLCLGHSAESVKKLQAVIFYLRRHNG